MTKIFDFPVYYKIQVNEETGNVKVFSNSKHAKGRELSQFKNPSGYLRVKMNNKSYEIHFLVALFYLGKRPENLCVNHKDGNKLNNRPSNLEYITIADNIKHAVEHGLHVCNDPKRSGRYIDGRTLDTVKYKKQWYQQNRQKILEKAKSRYLSQKEKDCSLTWK